MRFVIGIFLTNDAVSSLAQSLKSSGYDPGALTIISHARPTGYLASIGARFVNALEETRIYGDVAIEVPGLRAPAPSELEAQASSPVLEALSDLAVPDGRTDDYLKAVDAGRCVAGYAAGDRADAVRELFSGAGGNPVSIY